MVRAKATISPNLTCSSSNENSSFAFELEIQNMTKRRATSLKQTIQLTKILDKKRIEFLAKGWVVLIRLDVVEPTSDVFSTAWTSLSSSPRQSCPVNPVCMLASAGGAVSTALRVRQDERHGV